MTPREGCGRFERFHARRPDDAGRIHDVRLGWNVRIEANRNRPDSGTGESATMSRSCSNAATAFRCVRGGSEAYCDFARASKRAELHLA